MPRRREPFFFNPKNFGEHFKGDCIVLSLSKTFHEDGGRKGGRIKDVIVYDSKKHYAILTAVVKRARENGLHVLVHGVKVGATEEPRENTTTRILQHLAEHDIEFTQYLSRTQVVRLLPPGTVESLIRRKRLRAKIT